MNVGFFCYAQVKSTLKHYFCLLWFCLLKCVPNWFPLRWITLDNTIISERISLCHWSHLAGWWQRQSPTKGLKTHGQSWRRDKQWKSYKEAWTLKNGPKSMAGHVPCQFMRRFIQGNSLPHGFPRYFLVLLRRKLGDYGLVRHPLPLKHFASLILGKVLPLSTLSLL